MIVLTAFSDSGREMIPPGWQGVVRDSIRLCRCGELTNRCLAGLAGSW
jgi:hypothetical protein